MLMSPWPDRAIGDGRQDIHQVRKADGSCRLARNLEFASRALTAVLEAGRFGAFVICMYSARGFASTCCCSRTISMYYSGIGQIKAKMRPVYYFTLFLDFVLSQT